MFSLAPYLKTGYFQIKVLKQDIKITPSPRTNSHLHFSDIGLQPRGDFYIFTFVFWTGPHATHPNFFPLDSYVKSHASEIPFWIGGPADCEKRNDNSLLLWKEKKKKKNGKWDTHAQFSIRFESHWYNSQEKTSHATHNAEQFVMALCTSNQIYLLCFDKKKG